MADAQLLEIGDERDGVLKPEIPVKLEPVRRSGDAYGRASYGFFLRSA